MGTGGGGREVKHAPDRCFGVAPNTDKLVRVFGVFLAGRKGIMFLLRSPE